MKKTLLSCGVATILALSAGAAMATSGVLDPGLYTITFSGAGVASETDPVGISGTGATRDIEISSATGSETIHLNVSGTSLSGSANLSGVAVTLSGSASGTGASGTFHASRSGRAGNGGFTIAKRSGVVAHMQRTSNSASSGSWFDDMCAWFGGFLGGSGAGPAAPTTPTGSGSTSHGLATYTPH